jgi:hypothetical protein
MTRIKLSKEKLLLLLSIICCYLSFQLPAKAMDELAYCERNMHIRKDQMELFHETVNALKSSMPILDQITSGFQRLRTVRNEGCNEVIRGLENFLYDDIEDLKRNFPDKAYNDLPTRSVNSIYSDFHRLFDRVSKRCYGSNLESVAYSKQDQELGKQISDNVENLKRTFRDQLKSYERRYHEAHDEYRHCEYLINLNATKTHTPTPPIMLHNASNTMTEESGIKDFFRSELFIYFNTEAARIITPHAVRMALEIRGYPRQTSKRVASLIRCGLTLYNLPSYGPALAGTAIRTASRYLGFSDQTSVITTAAMSIGAVVTQGYINGHESLIAYATNYVIAMGGSFAISEAVFRVTPWAIGLLSDMVDRMIIW